MRRHMAERLRVYSDDVSAHWDAWRGRQTDMLTAVGAIALATARFAVRLFRKPPTRNRKQAIHYLKKGMAAFNAGDAERAAKLFRKALEHDEGYARAHTYLGHALYRQKRLTDAVHHWNRAIAVEPRSEAAESARAKLRRISQGHDPTIARLKDELGSH